MLEVAPTLRVDFDRAAFLRTRWQRQPCLIRRAWSAWDNPLAPSQLLALAARTEVESRLVRQVRGQWRVEHGPCVGARLAQRDWTLLVQAVDQHVPAVAALQDAFAFIPAWRMDDVMVSLAADRGGVGPHFDQYDVFLIQGLGRRRWRVGGRCHASTPLLPHDELRLLAEFTSHAEHVLEPGDMLYLPARHAHEGVALGADCMTYSVGFRAPSTAELVGHWCDEVVTRLGEDERYTDGPLAANAEHGEITAAALARLQRMAVAALGERRAFADWFGRYTSERRNPDVDLRPARALSASALERRCAQGALLERQPASRYVFIRAPRALTLYVDGEAHTVRGAAARLAARLCARRDITLGDADLRAAAELRLATALYNQGSLRFRRKPR